MSHERSMGTRRGARTEGATGARDEGDERGGSACVV